MPGPEAMKHLAKYEAKLNDVAKKVDLAIGEVQKARQKFPARPSGIPEELLPAYTKRQADMIKTFNDMDREFAGLKKMVRDLLTTVKKESQQSSRR